MKASRVAWLALSAAAVFCGGCGHAANEHPTAKLAGHVMIDGKQIGDGRIQFFPLGNGPGSGQPAESLISQGSYAADRVPLGKVRVNFTAIKESGRIMNEGGHVFPELVSIIPDEYQQGLDIEVSGDDPSKDFNLVSK